MGRSCCSGRCVMIILLLSAVPLAVIVSLESSKPSAHVYSYHSLGWLRECAKWDPPSRRFVVSSMSGGLSHVTVPDGADATAVLTEVVAVRDGDVAGNGTLGLAVDGARGRVVAVHADVLGNRYSAVAAYDSSTWRRLFLTQLNQGEEKTLADDVAVDSQGNAYVTDTLTNKIWKVSEDGKFLTTITSPLFTPKEWYKNLVGLNGIAYHPNGYLIVVHTFSGNLFKVEINKGNQVKIISVKGGSLVTGDGMELLTPTKLVVAGNPSRLVESTDDWETAEVAGKFWGPMHRLTTSATVKDGKVYLNHMFGLGYPKKKHVLVEANFS